MSIPPPSPFPLFVGQNVISRQIVCVFARVENGLFFLLAHMNPLFTGNVVVSWQFVMCVQGSFGMRIGLFGCVRRALLMSVYPIHTSQCAGYIAISWQFVTISSSL